MQLIHRLNWLIFYLMSLLLCMLSPSNDADGEVSHKPLAGGGRTDTMKPREQERDWRRHSEERCEYWVTLLGTYPIRQTFGGIMCKTTRELYSHTHVHTHTHTRKHAHRLTKVLVPYCLFICLSSRETSSLLGEVQHVIMFVTGGLTFYNNTC